MFKTVAGVQEALTQKQPPVFCSWEDNHITMEDQTIDLKLPKFRDAGKLYTAVLTVVVLPTLSKTAIST
jgi:hypothetical protein